MSLQARLDAALREQEFLTQLQHDHRTQRWLQGGTASSARRAQRQRRDPHWQPSTSLASTVLRQAQEERAALLQLQAERGAVLPGDSHSEVGGPATTRSAGAVPPSPTSLRLYEERDRLRLLKQISEQKLAEVRALEQHKAELQAAARRAGGDTDTALSSRPQLRATAPTFETGADADAARQLREYPPLSSSAAATVTAPAVAASTLTYVSSFRPEEQDTSGAPWPYHVESSLTLVLSDSLMTSSSSSGSGSGGDAELAEDSLGFVLTRRDRIQRKQGDPQLADAEREHVTIREWIGDCSLIPDTSGWGLAAGAGSAAAAGGGGGGGAVEVDATLRARRRRNYHRPPQRSAADSTDAEGAGRQQEEQEQQHDEVFAVPVVRGGRITASGTKFVVWGWGGDETVTLVAASSGSGDSTS
jgi:hypothetical protein